MNSVKFENTALPDVIELKNINQTYDDPKKGKVTVIDNLSLLIEDKPNQGQFVVVLGRSGCGKSTILRFIAGLQKPSSGEVLIKGKPRISLPPTEDKVGMVFQQYSSLPWLSVLDNVSLGMKIAGIPYKERKEKAMEMIKTVGLEGHENKYAKYPTLSGGQLQRVAIARSLLTNPEILLMDEPFGALDAYTRASMQNLLSDLWNKLQMTVIFVTHDIPEAVFLGDEIWIMSSNPGRIVDRIQIGIPLNRAKEMKRTKQFTDIVYDVEDRLTKL